MVFSLRQLQEKYREEQMPLYIAFVDLTKAFDQVIRDVLFTVLPNIDCLPKMQSMIESFHTDTKGTVQFNGSSSEPFEIHPSAHVCRAHFLLQLIRLGDRKNNALATEHYTATWYASACYSYCFESANAMHCNGRT